MTEIYGLWQKGIKPSNWTPDYGQCLKNEIERWENDLKKEQAEERDFQGNWGIGIYK